ncbi:hypothetical protein GMD78_19300 [Ornithinibacillus sp. L9]|uniref:Uncharacterized protein n=1 Tax=Ornithinibacillus caprae TaxID=2678566 RepID=A0A6N8FRQ6_9BACI|nr:hypothetical protein [Ornithinibacillus caprae]MUK90508.1 hypothetical protein [Ornithinibacillus caprae]
MKLSFSKKRFKVLMLGIMCLTLLIAPLNTSAENIDTNQDSENILQYETLEGGEKNHYLRALEKSDIFKNNVSSKNLDKKYALVADLGEHDYADEDIIMINAVVKNPQNDEIDVVYAFLSKESNDVLKLSHFSINDELTTYKDYDEYGTLMIHNEYSTNDFSEGNIDNPLFEYNHNPGNSIQVSDFWVKFACGFGGLYTCTLGCLAFAGLGPGAVSLCVTMCGLVWGAALC